MPTGYSARHVRWEMDRHCVLCLLLFLLLLLALREAALLFQLKVILSCKFLQKSAHCVALDLMRKHNHTSAGWRQYVGSFYVQMSLLNF